MVLLRVFRSRGENLDFFFLARKRGSSRESADEFRLLQARQAFLAWLEHQDAERTAVKARMLRGSGGRAMASEGVLATLEAGWQAISSLGAAQGVIGGVGVDRLSTPRWSPPQWANHSGPGAVQSTTIPSARNRPA